MDTSRLNPTPPRQPKSHRASVCLPPLSFVLTQYTGRNSARQDESGKGKTGKEWSEKYKEKDDRNYNDKDNYGRDKDRERWSERYEKKDREMYFHRHGYERLDIPKGHYPPPGECRIWYPDRPAGQQPAPTGCRNIPSSGAWAIRHPAHNPGHVYADVFDLSLFFGCASSLLLSRGGELPAEATDASGIEGQVLSPLDRSFLVNYNINIQQDKMSHMFKDLVMKGNLCQSDTSPALYI